MKAWFTRMLAALRAWMRANEEAHARAKPSACCAHPPPGATGSDSDRAPQE